MPGGAIRLSFALRYYLHRVRQDAAWGWAMVNISAGGPIFGEEAACYAVEAIEEGLVTEQFAVPNVAIGFDLVMGSALSAMATLLRSEQAEEYPELMIAQIFRGMGVSETMIEKCTLPPLPDPFEFIAAHGMGSEHDLIDASPFLAPSQRD
ncbi:MAG: hypothetical protein QHC67_10400 [Sphingobium sp.]|uniref:hypothetical protein n=1 Tax=Sphingobium sp. TaxID=1912891 RepID=UPI0029A3C758|nr:hypothetical protein [Sphingobium sp.]MDX3910215.1 hypothetical protein [Sphingobium sp.]